MSSARTNPSSCVGAAAVVWEAEESEAAVGIVLETWPRQAGTRAGGGNE
jgi:hypothetical protein